MLVQIQKGAVAWFCACMVFLSTAMAADLPVPAQDRSAILFIFVGELKGKAIDVDMGSQKIDSIYGAADKAFVKQYILKPGGYSFSAEGSQGPITINAGAGKISLLKYKVQDQNGGKVLLVNHWANLDRAEAEQFKKFLAFWNPDFEITKSKDLSGFKINDFSVGLRPIGPLPPDDDPGGTDDRKKPK